VQSGNDTYLVNRLFRPTSLTASLAGAADNISTAFTTIFAAFKADEAFDHANEAVPRFATTSEAKGTRFLLVLLGLVLINGGLELEGHLRGVGRRRLGTVSLHCVW